MLDDKDAFGRNAWEDLRTLVENIKMVKSYGLPNDLHKMVFSIHCNFTKSFLIKHAVEIDVEIQGDLA